MFWNWFWKSPERKREIFCYWDGCKARSADPLVVYRLLKDDKEFNIDVHPAFVDEGDMDAIRVTAAAVRSAFGVKSLDAGGLTEQECITLLLDYFGWVEQKKNNSSPPPTLQPDTDTTPPPDSPETATSLPAGCTSTDIEPR